MLPWETKIDAEHLSFPQMIYRWWIFPHLCWFTGGFVCIMRIAAESTLIEYVFIEYHRICICRRTSPKSILKWMMIDIISGNQSWFPYELLRHLHFLGISSFLMFSVRDHLRIKHAWFHQLGQPPWIVRSQPRMTLVNPSPGDFNVPGTAVSTHGSAPPLRYLHCHRGPSSGKCPARKPWNDETACSGLMIDDSGLIA